jgi:hypothetical protein
MNQKQTLAINNFLERSLLIGKKFKLFIDKVTKGIIKIEFKREVAKK